MIWGSFDMGPSRPGAAIMDGERLLELVSVERKGKNKAVTTTWWSSEEGARQTTYKDPRPVELLMLKALTYYGGSKRPTLLPTAFIMEGGFVGRNKKTAIDLARSRGFFEGLVFSDNYLRGSFLWMPKPDEWRKPVWAAHGLQPSSNEQNLKEVSVALAKASIVADYGVPEAGLAWLRDDEADAYNMARAFILTGRLMTMSGAT